MAEDGRHIPGNASHCKSSQDGRALEVVLFWLPNLSYPTSPQEEQSGCFWRIRVLGIPVQSLVVLDPWLTAPEICDILPCNTFALSPSRSLTGDS